MSHQVPPESAAPADDDTPLVFVDSEPAPATVEGKTWKVLIADDDPEVHFITQMVLRDLVFEGRLLELISAHSGAEALRLLGEHPDMAVVLLDVVMETEHAGLEVARSIRWTLGNRFVRIILRTGQPGQAPEKHVVIDYDINDYKEKTELTAQKLVTTVISALRSYRDIVTIDRSRQGLTKIIEASRDIFRPQSLTRLSSGVLQQISALLHLGEDGMLAQASGLTARLEISGGPDNYIVMAGTGRFATAIGQPLARILDQAELEVLRQIPCEQSVVRNGEFIGHFCTANGAESFILVQTQEARNEVDVDLLQLYAANIGVAFDNAHLNEELAATQSELVNTLCEVVEARSNETGLHVVRVGELSCLLAERAGHDERDCALLRQTAPMHDLGKIGIPDHILQKPGPLTAEEWVTMREHTRIGHNLLRHSRRPALRTAAIIAAQHHERWDGSGYPYGLRGNDIHIFGRIVCLIDVFDALSHPRCYKEAWEIPRIVEYIRERSGSQFDPALVDIFLAHVDDFVELWGRYAEH